MDEKKKYKTNGILYKYEKLSGFQKTIVSIILLLIIIAPIVFGVRLYSIKTLENNIITKVENTAKDERYNINVVNSILTYIDIWDSGYGKYRKYVLTVFSSNFDKIPNGSKYNFINSLNGIEGNAIIDTRVVSNDGNYDISKYPDEVLNKNDEVFYIFKKGEKPKSTFTSPKSKLEIQEGWKWVQDGNYTYITGRVKNMTDSNITYFKLTAEYLDDAGNILDTDYTNSGETIKPGAMKEFEIMHIDREEYKKVRLIVEEVDN